MMTTNASPSPNTSEAEQEAKKARIRASKRAYMRRWRQAHPEEARARVRASLASHPETTAKQYANYLAWAAEHPGEAHARSRRNQATWNEKHPGKAAARTKAWSKANPQRRHAAQARRRARKNAAPVNDFTAEQWEEMQKAHGYRCVYCGKKPQRLTQDHITPLSEGGSHTASNILPACRSCNAKKHVGPPLKPVQPLLIMETTKNVLAVKRALQER